MRDLGAPTLLGSMVGAVIGALAQRHGRAVEHGRALDMLVLQWERAAADAAHTALAELRRRSLDGQDPGDLHNRWQDTVLPQIARVGDLEISRRAGVVGWELFLAVHAHKLSSWSFAAPRRSRTPKRR